MQLKRKILPAMVAVSVLFAVLLALTYSSQAQKPVQDGVQNPVQTPENVRQVKVKIGESVTSEDLTMELISVDEDSRCPQGVDCFWAGQAGITIKISKNGQQQEIASLKTQGENASYAYQNNTLTLSDLSPYPSADVALDRDAYVATITITANPAGEAFTEPAGLPLELQIVAKQKAYVLDYNGLTEDEYLKSILPPKKEQGNKPQLKPTVKKLPPAPKVDLEIQIKNTGQEVMKFWAGGDGSRLDLDLQGEGAVSVDAQLMFTMEFRLPKTITLKPGETWSMPVTSLNYGQRGIAKRAFWTKPGHYNLTAIFSSSASLKPTAKLKDGEEDLSPIKLTSAPVSLTVHPVGYDINTPSLEKWQTVFADEKWYLDQAGAEQTFAGVLQKVPVTGEATILMRTSLYKLGKHTIYSAAKPHPALEALVGTNVEMKGKLVEMELEGQ